MELTEIRRAELELERANHVQAIAQHRLRALQVAQEAEELEGRVADAEAKIKEIDRELAKDGAQS